MRTRPLDLVAPALLTALLAGCGAAAPALEPAAQPSPAAPEGAAGAPSMQPEYDAPQEEDRASAAVDEKDEEAAPGAQPLAAAPPLPAPPVAPAPVSPSPARVAQSTPATSAPRPEARGRAAGAAPAPKKASAQAPAARPAAPPAAVAVTAPEPQGSESYRDYGVNPVEDPVKDRLSTFAIDVDTASYAIARRKILDGALPPYQAVRAEEFLNYFDYGYASPTTGPFAVHLAAAPSPFTVGHHLVRVAVQGKRVPVKERTPVHLVYLVDTSGSMHAPDRIELAKKSLKLLTESLKPGDTVALCTYAGSVREVLAPTGIESKGKILAAIADLTAGGSTAMASGIDLAYSLAERTLVKGHINRVVVLSDGDANVGPTSHDEILKTIKRARDKGITLSTVGFGQGNYKDLMMEQLANQGDGNYSYIDSEAQARRVFSDQVGGMLQVIARDVKIQVEFDPSFVKSYRLIGYENRNVADRDFRNDKVDAGEIGAGHSVTAIYDVELKASAPRGEGASPVVVRLRHKAPLGSDVAEETLVKMAPGAIAPTFDAAPADLRFASAVAGFSEILRHSPHARSWRLSDVEKIARAAASSKGDQQEFIGIVRRAGALAGGKTDAVAARIAD
ncbi:von Willebrand factor type A domain-containing protein [Sorangium sp. So ce260]|uniref:vWA domain-containing protein n=1 Tax=Sorangium sp. So ce260 TaxID=3133291 RepID=UPI003F5F771D